MKMCSRKDCEHGGKLQKLERFYRSSSSKDGHAGHCKTCMDKYKLQTLEKQRTKDNWLSLIIGGERYV